LEEKANKRTDKRKQKLSPIFAKAGRNYPGKNIPGRKFSTRGEQPMKEKMRSTFDAFADLLDDAVDRIPDRFLRDLTGGFNLRREAKREDDYFILGEYVEDGLGGCFIVFYYGSFAVLLADEPVTVWEAEIIDTVLHEMQHHLEAMAGRDDLAQQEMEELERALQKGE